jgi:hypothetical protein
VGVVDWTFNGDIYPGLGRIDTGDLSGLGVGDLSIQIDGVIGGISHGQLRVAGSVSLGASKNLFLDPESTLLPVQELY